MVAFTLDNHTKTSPVQTPHPKLHPTPTTPSLKSQFLPWRAPWIPVRPQGTSRAARGGRPEKMSSCWPVSLGGGRPCVGREARRAPGGVRPSEAGRAGRSPSPEDYFAGAASLPSALHRFPRPLRIRTLRPNGCDIM